MPKLEETDITDYSDLVDDGKDEKVVESDDRTSPAGEIIPDDSKTIKDEIIEPAQPVKVEEPEKVIEDTTGTPENPYDTRFKELGLDTQFKGGVEEMFSKQPATNKYISDLERERNYYRDEANRAPEAKPEVSLTGEDFDNDPMAVVNQIVDSKITHVNTQLANMEAKQFINSKSDYTKLEPLMMAEARENPALAAMGVAAIPILYKMAKATELSQAKAATTVPPPVTQEQKDNATTTTGRKEVTPNKNDPRYWQGKTVKEMEDEIGMLPEQ
jgi:hypothetical protein